MFAKYEAANPGASIKDRAACSIDRAEGAGGSRRGAACSWSRRAATPASPSP
ncbi:MAG: hypothetical protein ACLSVD_11245 [Eggerthellaceae bacterium]